MYVQYNRSRSRACIPSFVALISSAVAFLLVLRIWLICTTLLIMQTMIAAAPTISASFILHSVSFPILHDFLCSNLMLCQYAPPPHSAALSTHALHHSENRKPSSILNSNKQNEIRQAVTTDTYTQTDGAYTAYANMYRIMTHINNLSNTKKFKATHGSKCKIVDICAYLTSDPSYCFPISVLKNSSIRGICNLNQEITIEIGWIYWD